MQILGDDNGQICDCEDHGQPTGPTCRHAREVSEGAPYKIVWAACARDGRSKLHCDVAHPINAAMRASIQDAIIRAFQEELSRSKQPGYIPAKMDEYDDFDPTLAAS